ncbi:hypothetical protein HZU72_17805 [Halomonas sp. QX-2]|uniref:Uncharacterized protein n=1 Tax=Vreelandella sedimenti TaxID=2729618 RepID=A0A7Z0NAP7_9GAMM|nr:hypothetical protein [Halomonas sedimenti]NYT74269.1 hypothetical protein [Halomonas sedimenti]
MDKNGIILLLFFASTLFAGLYFAAREDISELRQQTQMLFQMLPESQQRRLVDDWETRMDMLDTGPHQNQWDR